MPLYVHYQKDDLLDKKTGDVLVKAGTIVSFQEAPDDQADEIPDGLDAITITDKTRPVWVKDQAQPEMHYVDVNGMKVVNGQLVKK